MFTNRAIWSRVQALVEPFFYLTAKGFKTRWIDEFDSCFDAVDIAVHEYTRHTRVQGEF